MESLRFMLGGALRKSAAATKVIVNLTEQATVETANTVPTLKDHLYSNTVYTLPTKYRFINLTAGTRGQVDTSIPDDEDAPAGVSKSFVAAKGDLVRFFWTEETVANDAAVEITISPDTFPGTLTRQTYRAPRGEQKITNQFGELLEAVA